MEPKFVYVTCKNREEALEIGKGIVEDRLAACANVIGGMEAIYWWEGKVVTGTEAVLIMKSRSGLIERLIEKVKELHSYSVPCIVSLPIETGNPEYLKWIREETGG
jgi:periplasmic divalent cation tolerance protein